MSASTKAKRPRSPRRTTADRQLDEHIAKADTRTLNSGGWGIAMLDTGGFTVAELENVSLRTVIGVLSLWKLELDCGWQIIPPSQEGGAV